MPYETHEVVYQREILYGAPGTTVYRNGIPGLWIPDDFGSLTRHLSLEELGMIKIELKRYFDPASTDGRADQ